MLYKSGVLGEGGHPSCLLPATASPSINQQHRDYVYKKHGNQQKPVGLSLFSLLLFCPFGRTVLLYIDCRKPGEFLRTVGLYSSNFSLFGKSLSHCLTTIDAPVEFLSAQCYGTGHTHSQSVRASQAPRSVFMTLFTASTQDIVLPFYRAPLVHTDTHPHLGAGSRCQEQPTRGPQGPGGRALSLARSLAPRISLGGWVDGAVLLVLNKRSILLW